MSQHNGHNGQLMTRTLLGAAAGLTGTVVLQALRTASQKYAPSTMPPMRGDAGEFMAHQAKRAMPRNVAQQIPKKVESAVGMSLGLGYGMFFGALFAMIHPHPRSIVANGAALGLACWAAGYLGWLPASGLMKPVSKQRPAQIIAPPIRHALYGIATVAAYERLAKLVDS
ncbi:MAG TPA: hypothetical protein VKK61_12265 [Tepidisphaeraceae bacterium]|nr:hypothetical protein [Tepidisphaeraceae bacterium]